MNSPMPLWAQRLLARHPSASPPTANDPLPSWLAEELRKIPLWAFIRGADDVRTRHPYFLIEDVRAQPELMRGVLALHGQLTELSDALSAIGVEKLIFTGCGSAFFNSLFGAHLFPDWTGLAAEAVESLELVNYGCQSTGDKRTAVIAQSATGGSIETLDALRRARHEGLTTIGLTNTIGSSMDGLCDYVVAFPTGQRCGPDVSVITTRLMMMYLLALELGRRTGKLSAAKADLLARQIDELPAMAGRFLEREESGLAAVARELCGQTALLFIGGGPNWFSAREAALKVEEESSMVCKAYRPAEFPHDAIALLSPQVTTVAIAPPGPSYQRVADSLRTGQAAGARGLAFVADDDRQLATQADFVVRAGAVADEIFMPPLATILGQTLGYYLGVERGYNPDTLRTDNLDHARAWLTSFPLGTH
jgi:glucosamine--fructose-6-phosphate aminotransferase (isomerizing)